MRPGKRGFTLLEAMFAALILVIVGGGIAGVYILENGLISHVSHRLEAVNYARSVAENLINLATPYADTETEPRLSPGTHNELAICGLPDNYFSKHLKGKLSYTIQDIGLPDPVYKARRAQITVEWTERFPKTENKREDLFLVVNYVK